MNEIQEIAAPPVDHRRTLDDWLEAVSVDDIDMLSTQYGYVKGWFGVSTDDDGGYIAFFRDQVDAFRFRLDYINRKMNP